MEIQVRPLKTMDLFPMSRILKKMDLKDSLKHIATLKRDEASQKKLGFEILMTALENIHLAEAEVIAFLADLTGMKPDKLKELELSEFMKVIDQFKGQKSFASFLQQAAK
ncbi:hypothetical protein [Paenibacillus radicis (ex Xue et al. 2023)]|uniref:Phage tail assembly protein n=1 Tax=Paenibacillus radicis (ex Xue et al. 2023) TaxID=2972489 RepID=A0ABT1YRF7_9BACL|nr:hypothetical protein [Paenibacillus radicis (ex Xue et al. 2023)]MCR8635746.1 hypothetical protein [Paenibacillus radicis (ex Xue et al. 2023)]